MPATEQHDDDLWLVHGQGYMVREFGSRIPYCGACENARCGQPMPLARVFADLPPHHRERIQARVRELVAEERARRRQC
jgi:hypothetical protein